MADKIPRLLAISDRRELASRQFETWLGELARAGVDAVQIRDKELGDGELYELVLTAVEASARPPLVLVNSRLDIALAAGADGVHLSADGLPIAPLRKRFGSQLLIGCSTHHPAEVEAARRAGADYVTFGPLFATPSKMRYGPPPGLAGLREAAAMGLPVIALGGVGPERLAEVVAAGAAGVAGIRAFHQPDSLGHWPRARQKVWPERPAGGQPAVSTATGDGDLAILGIGLDLVELERIARLYERYGEAFIRRFCRPGEWQPRRGGALIEHLGGLFAAKEAVLKALGTGWAEGLAFHQAEVVRLPSGAPSVRLHGAAAERSRRLGTSRIHLTITHERTHAAAVAILEGTRPGAGEDGE